MRKILSLILALGFILISSFAFAGDQITVWDNVNKKFKVLADGSPDQAIKTDGSEGISWATIEGLPKAEAGGTVDAITADFSPDISLTDKTTVAVIAAGANSSASPTFVPDGLTPHAITKQGGQTLLPGDIPASGFVALLEYNSANTRWELLNPSSKPYADTKLSKSIPGEIVVITEKITLSENDEVLIEDSENSNAKKSAKLSNILGLVSSPFSSDVSAGDYVNYDDLSTQSCTGTWTKRYEVKLSRGGEYRILIDLKRGYISDPVSARVYKNGVAVGTTLTNTYSDSDWHYDYSDDVSGFSSGDLLQVYTYMSGGTPGYAANFRVKSNDIAPMVSKISLEDRLDPSLD